MLKEIEHNINQEANEFDESLIDLDPKNHLNFYLKMAKSYRFPCLTLEDEINLSTRIQNGLTIKNDKEPKRLSNVILNEDAKNAFDFLVKKNLLMPVKYAAKFKYNKNEFSDLIQCGNLGLMDAAIKYDPTLRNKFSTYAYYTIKDEILDYVRCKGLIKLPSYYSDRIITMNRNYDILTQLLKRIPTNVELFKQTGLSTDSIKQIKNIVKPPVSLNSRVYPDSDDEKIEMIVDTNNQDIFENIDVQINFECVLKIIKRLQKNNGISKRNVEIVLYRYGFVDGIPHTLEEASKVYKVTRARVNQIELSFLYKVKNLIPQDLVDS